MDGYYGISLFGSAAACSSASPADRAVSSESQEYVVENFGGTSRLQRGHRHAARNSAHRAQCEFMAGNDTFTLYVNPMPGAGEPLTGAVKTDADIGTCNSLTISSGYDATHTFVIDEIRLGATFESVTPRP
ncbi:MAG: hypothetical protein IPK15_01210 [Verrucomicrobia bacterium]|nr:hypothetical protein [Verrucomicrobiota bacterium]